MNLLKKKISRVIAFITACLLFTVCAFIFMDGYISYTEKREDYDETYYFMRYEESRRSVELQRKLWLVGNMYLRMCDEKGNFTGNKYLKKSTQDVLKKLGMMDENNKIVDLGKGEFEYSVSYGKAKISNTDRNIDENNDNKYMNITRGNSTECWGDYYYYLENYHWYDTNYGMSYYYYGDDSGAAVFDYDTEGLDYYIDELGAKIYYKYDGSTPVRMTSQYDRYEPIVETVTEVSSDLHIQLDEIREEVPDDLEETFTTEETDEERGFYIFDADKQQWVHVSNDKFIKYTGDEEPLKIYITPTADIIAEHEEIERIYKEEKEKLVNVLMDLVPLLIIVAVLSIYVVIAGGYDPKQKKFVSGKFEKYIFTEIVIMVLFTGAYYLNCMILMLAGDIPHDYIAYSVKDIVDVFDDYKTAGCVCGILSGLMFALTLFMLKSLVVKIRCRCILSSSFAVCVLKYLFRKMKKPIAGFNCLLRDNVLSGRFVMRTVIFTIIMAIVTIVAIEMCFPLYVTVFMIACILVAFVYLTLKDLKEIKSLSEHISEINMGNYSQREVPADSMIYGMTGNLNNISAGIGTAVEKQIKSERMKIDLVTNVSHDLKTPLTSIISYINLLSMEELTPEAADYVKILEQKSARLSDIVSDLFDLAKATSRTDVKLEVIDAVILTNQVLADMSDKIESSGKQLRTDISAESAMLYAEGKKLYRVLQNIIDNALKYSMEGTRIYLKLFKEDNKVKISLKNISSYEMTFTPEEIIERFTRGDKSRTGDGHGLGLSIARSFTEACGGSFRVIVDGDVFISEIEFEIIDEKNNVAELKEEK